MSVAEMKLKAVEGIIKLKEEKAVEEILHHLERLDTERNDTVNLAKHYAAIKEQYGNVLEKLAK